MARIDLHTHSIYSDGENTPAELLQLARNNNIVTLSLTDHDNIEGSKELVKLPHPDITIYSGVELTAKTSKGRMHILGYNIDLDNIPLNKVLKEQKDNAIYNILMYIDILRKDFNLTIPQSKVDKILNLKGNIGRPQLALLLIELGYCISVEDAFQKYLIYAYDKARQNKKGLTKEECLELIINANGTPILAHPNSLKKDYLELKKEIIYLKGLGLQGLETTHPNLNEEERLSYHHLALELGLLESGGTDYHGLKIKPDINLGTGRNNNVDIKPNSLTLTKKVKSRY